MNFPQGYGEYAPPGSLAFCFASDRNGRKRSEKICNGRREGWGRLKATAKIGNSEWATAIWFDTKINTYLLPLKAGN